MIGKAFWKRRCLVALVINKFLSSSSESRRRWMERYICTDRKLRGNINSTIRLDVWQGISQERQTGTRGRALWSVFCSLGHSESNGLLLMYLSKAVNMVNSLGWCSDSAVWRANSESWCGNRRTSEGRVSNYGLQIWPVVCFGPWAKKGFYIFKWLGKKNKRKIMFCDM